MATYSPGTNTYVCRKLNEICESSFELLCTQVKMDSSGITGVNHVYLQLSPGDTIGILTT